MVIRRKELKNCESWVDINVSSWNDNLKGIVSDRLLEIITNNKESRIKDDREHFKEIDADYVLEDNNRVLEILKIKQSERDGYQDCGEIQVLYLYTEEKGKGYGKALIYKAFELLKGRGYEKVVIGCLDGNPANEFYDIWAENLLDKIFGLFLMNAIWKMFINMIYLNFFMNLCEIRYSR